VEIPHLNWACIHWRLCDPNRPYIKKNSRALLVSYAGVSSYTLKEKTMLQYHEDVDGSIKCKRTAFVTLLFLMLYFTLILAEFLKSDLIFFFEDVYSIAVFKKVEYFVSYLSVTKCFSLTLYTLLFA
jgi:uncharacterized membrane protein